MLPWNPGLTKLPHPIEDPFVHFRVRVGSSWSIRSSIFDFVHLGLGFEMLIAEMNRFKLNHSICQSLQMKIGVSTNQILFYFRGS